VEGFSDPRGYCISTQPEWTALMSQQPARRKWLLKLAKMLLVAVAILVGGMVNLTILLVILANIFHRY
jgi:hypothetical protein